MAVVAIQVLFLPRKHVIVPILAVMFLIPYGQHEMVAGLNFPMLLVLISRPGMMKSSIFSSGKRRPIWS